MTAGPVRREVITPTREEAPAGSASQLAIKQPLTTRLPWALTRAKSRPCLSRRSRGKPNEPDAGAVIAVAYTGVRRLRPSRRRLRSVAFPRLLELRAKTPCCRLRRIRDG